MTRLPTTHPAALPRALALLCITLAAAGCGDSGKAGEDDAGTNINDAEACSDTCTGEGSATCDATGTGRFVCTLQQDECLYPVHEPCETDYRCFSGSCVPCGGDPGTFRDQVLPSGGEDRFYYLYVPDAYDCADPWPVMFDLHGSGGTPRPEELYGLDGARATASASGFILVRARSRSSMEGSQEVYRWDQNPGDPERNRVFLNELAAHLSTTYHVDPDRIYVMGFSSGTNQTAVALADPAGPFDGFGFVGGGAWNAASIPSTAARLYLVTGFRDYMRIYHNDLMDMVTAASIPSDQIFIRETDMGHELYAWMYPEMWAFLDGGLRPPPGNLNPGWTEETTGTSWSLLALTGLPNGDHLAVGENGTLFTRDASDGSWNEVTATGTPAFAGRAFTGVCVTTDGTGMAVGSGLTAFSHDSGLTWTYGPLIPEFGPPMMGYSWLNGVGCGTSRIVGIGYWTGVQSDNGGSTFSDVNFDAGGYRASGAAIAASGWGTWMAAGYFHYAARSADNGQTWSQVSFMPWVEWVYDVAPVSQDIWVMVAENGHVWRSVDDGATFSTVRVGPGPDLYAVAFRDASTGLAVGLGGAAFLTTDGGVTWTDVSAGVDRFLGDVRWLAEGTALVVGEGGTALRFAP